MNAAYQKLCARLMMAGVPDARFDAAQLYTFVTGRDHRLDDGPTAEEASRLQVLAERRAGREPLQYLLGEWDFLDFYPQGRPRRAFAPVPTARSSARPPSSC